MCTHVGITGMDVWVVPFQLCLCPPSLMAATSINLGNGGGWCKSVRAARWPSALHPLPRAGSKGTCLNCSATSRPAARPPQCRRLTRGRSGGDQARDVGGSELLPLPLILVSLSPPPSPLLTPRTRGVHQQTATRCCAGHDPEVSPNFHVGAPWRD